MAKEENGGKPEKLPFTGRLFSEDGPFELDEFRILIRSQTDGAWAGKVFLDVEYQGEIISAEAVSGQTQRFAFLNKILVADCKKATAYLPTHWEGTLSEEPRAALTGKCRAFEEEYHGMPSVVLENDHVRLRVLPKLGGRIIEFRSADGGQNHLLAETTLLQKGVASSWAPYGGIHYNPGGFPGEFWNLEHAWKIEESENEIRLILERSFPVSWSQGKRGSGRGSLAGEIVLRKNEARVRVQVDMYNDSSAATHMQLRTHGMFATIGSGDMLLYPGDSEVIEMPFSQLRRGGVVDNRGSWLGVARGAMKQVIVQSFDQDAVAKLLYTPPSAASAATCFEANTAEWLLEAGEKGTFVYHLELIRGLPKITSFENGDALWLDLTDASIVQGMLSTSQAQSKGEISIKKSGPDGDDELLNAEVSVLPLDPYQVMQASKMELAEDGNYKFHMKWNSSAEITLLAEADVRINQAGDSDRSNQIKNFRNVLQEILKAPEITEKQRLSAARGMVALGRAQTALEQKKSGEFEQHLNHADLLIKDLQEENQK